VLGRLRAEGGRAASPAEQAVLARWSGWGAVPEVFDETRPRFAAARAEVRRLLGTEGYAAAARNTLNAHYTDAALVCVIWAGVSKLGFTSGRVLEPGCGSGNFLGFAPAGAQLVGIELEPVTAAIAQVLYPQAQVLAESFAQTRAPAGSFDLTIGNVPFGRVALTDPRHNRGGHSIHNHFILKSLELTRPGGLVAVLTSRYTMDARNPAARREMAALADLVGAVRLPSGAHDRAAGTSVVTDLLLLRRREPDRQPDPTAWERTSALALPGGEATVNEYFLEHPHALLGQPTLHRGSYDRDDLEITPWPGAVAEHLTRALERIVDHAHQAGLMMSPAATSRTASPAGPVAVVSGRSDRREGYLAATPEGGFTRVTDGVVEPYPVPASQAAELQRLLELRDAVVAVLEAEASCAEDSAELDELRADLNVRYDAYASTHGPLNRFSWRRTGRIDSATGEETMARIRPRQGGFRADPFAAVVYALEHFDSISQQASKADVFRQRVIAPRAPRLGADTAEDAVAICLDTHGQLHLSEVARLLGVTEAAAREQLGTLVFDDPATEALVPAAEYLSGNVRSKLTEAQHAARTDPRFAPNVAALSEVIPPDLGPEQIEARLGAAWINSSYVEQFLRETLGDPGLDVEHPGGSTWAVRGARHTVAATETWGTHRVPAPQLAQAVLEQRQVTVHDELEDGTRVLNLTETLAAQEKAAQLGARFSEWTWEDPARSQALARVYNDRFNAVVLRSYDNISLSLPGLAVTFTPRPHQLAAVARMIHEPAVGLYHEVGAGKTAEMVIGCMELRRLGLVTKPVVVVPNNMLEQFAREWQQLYPQAKLLIATKEDLTSQRRREFVARCATGSWDGVVMTRSAFERIPLSPTRQKDYLDRETELVREAIARSRAGKSLTVKRLERSLLAAEERIKAKLSGARDPGVTFEQTGIDYLVIDEAHGYKNLRTVSNIRDAAIDGSQRAQDLDQKLDYLRATRGERIATFATATPLANSMTEAYVMQRYLRPDLLEQAGLDDFDTWAATFGQLATAIELSPDGARFRMQTRFAKFANVPELLRMWHVSADIKTAEDLQLPTPALVARRGDGARTPETVVIPASPELTAYVAALGERADRVRSRGVDPSQDNMLKISTDGRLAALDLRLVDQDQDAPTKIDGAVRRITTLWREHREDVYRRPDGSAHPVRGSLQIVFCDLGTPREGWNVYDQLRTQLVGAGLPAAAVRFIHEARTDQEKGELFAACREGRVAVLIGSTERMGVGTNVQTRSVALHHLDCPWRPADLHQREGRIVRQGNQNPEVQILRYVTEGSFDAYLWQTVERKARFITQVMRGRLDVREIEDIGDTALSYSEVKALATGDPRVMEKAQADAELTRLERLARAHDRSQQRLVTTAQANHARADRLTQQAEAIAAALARRQSTRGDAFVLHVNGTTLTHRAQAGQRLTTLAEQALLARHTPGSPVTELATLGGLTITASCVRGQHGPELSLAFTGVPGEEIRMDLEELRQADPGGLISRLERRLTALEARHADTLAQAAQCRTEATHATEQLGKPFPHAQALTAARARAHEIDTTLHTLAVGLAEPPHQPSPGTPSAPTIGSPPPSGAPGPLPTPQPHHARR